MDVRLGTPPDLHVCTYVGKPKLDQESTYREKILKIVNTMLVTMTIEPNAIHKNAGIFSFADFWLNWI